MARRYSGKKGKSGSTKVATDKVPSWVNYKEKEVELMITKLAKEGKASAEIGLVLRDSYGIPSVKVLTKKTISQIMIEKKVYPQLPEDLINEIRTALNIREHIDENKKDMTAKRGLEISESKIRRLVKYYKRTKKVEESWKYNPKTAKLFIQ